MASSSTHENNSERIFDTIRNLTSTGTNQATKFGNSIKNGAYAARSKWKEASTVTKACIVGGTVAAVTPLIIIPALNVVGYTSGGVTFSSLAAFLQTPTTASGSIFALCQSAAATGVVAPTASVGVGAAAGVAAGGLTAAIYKKKPSNEETTENELAEDEKEKDSEEDHDHLCDLSEDKVQYKCYLALSKL